MVSSLVLLTAFVSIFAPQRSAQAQPAAPAANEVEPAAVLCVSSVDNAVDRMKFLFQSADMSLMGAFVESAAVGLSKGLDTTRPNGAYVIFEGDKPVVITFLPVNDLDGLLKVHRKRVGTAEDAGDGVLKLTGKSTMFIKKQGPWTFLAPEKQHLAKLPEDPTKLLGDLNRRYTISARIHARNVPPGVRDVAVKRVTRLLQRQIDRRVSKDDEKQSANQLGAEWTDAMAQWMDDAEEITLGLAIEPATNRSYLDLEVTSKEGSLLEKHLAALTGKKTAFPGFYLPEAAVAGTLTADIVEDNASRFMKMLAAAREKAHRTIDAEQLNTGNPDGGKPAKEVIDQLIAVLEETVKAGKLDAGMALVVAPESLNFVAGGQIADSSKLNAALEKLVKITNNDPDFPQITPNASQHAGVVMHQMKMSVPEKEADARRLFGETMNAVVGVGNGRWYLAFGPQCESIFKKVIDAPAGAAPQAQLVIALKPLLAFAASIDDNPMYKMALDLVAKDGVNDRVTLTTSAIDGGMRMRMDMYDGMWKAVGRSVQMAIIQAANGGNDE